MDQFRAEKSGFALEAQRKIHGKFDPMLAEQILGWIASVIGQKMNTNGEVENFVDTLKNGVVLCALANALEPGSVKKVNTSGMAFKQMENVGFFLDFCSNHVQKTELFQTVDLYEAQDPNAVLVCLASLARKSERLFGVAGYGPREAQGEKRIWSPNQLKAGEGIIGLQMGSNQGATQSGINIGNTRHM